METSFYEGLVISIHKNTSDLSKIRKELDTLGFKSSALKRAAHDSEIHSKTSEKFDILSYVKLDIPSAYRSIYNIMLNGGFYLLLIRCHSSRYEDLLNILSDFKPVNSKLIYKYIIKHYPKILDGYQVDSSILKNILDDHDKTVPQHDIKEDFAIFYHNMPVN